MITRKINWKASIGSVNSNEITTLETRLADFYACNPNYYGDIDFTAENWINEGEIGYADMVKYARSSESICEFGCGSANILKYFPELQSKYSGCDFSQALLQRNQEAFPAAHFETIKKPNVLPFEDKKFDLVFSVFVLEHCTSPSKLLDECTRILKPGGRLIILCPDFLGQGKMSSQRAGLTPGTTGAKLKKGLFFDALLTYFDSRIRIPLSSKRCLKKIKKSPQFFINLSPTVFEDPFSPDVDAIYLTSRSEIICHLSPAFIEEKNGDSLIKYVNDKRLIYIKMIKQ